MKKIVKGFIVKALIWEAKMVLRKYKPKVIAVTGSVGKTSTKDALYTVLASTFATRKSEKSFNSEIGVPLTILGFKNAWSNPFLWIKNILEGLIITVFSYPYPEWLVLEVGADKPGDIESVSEWLKPDIAVITRFGDVPVHVEFFPSIEDLVREKGYLAQELKPGGAFIYNGDDRRIRSFADTLNVEKISYGFLSENSVVGSHESFIYGTYDNSELEFPIGISCNVNHGSVSVSINLMGALGRHHMYPLLAAYSVGTFLKMDPEEMTKSLAKHVSPRGRMKLIPGIKDTLIIDDTYNSSPVAAEEALRSLASSECAGRKIAVLGDMLELGQYSTDEHRRIGALAANCAGVLITVGIRSRTTADGALDAGMDEKNVFQFDTAEEAGKWLQELLAPGDIVLIKGSQSVRMERAVAEVMRYPELKESQLVRQDEQWMRR